MKRWHECHSTDDEENSAPRHDIVSKVRLTLMSMNELLKTVRYSNLFDLNHLMDAIDSINDETRTSVSSNEENTNQATTTTAAATVTHPKDLFLIREKNYRGRLSKKILSRKF